MNRLIMTVAAVLAFGITVPAFAANPGDVMIADFLWIRMRCPASGYSIAERAEAVQARANDLLVLGGIDLSTVKVVAQGNDASIYANGKLLVTVDPCTAQANRTTVMKLANQWAERFKQIYPQVMPIAPGVPSQQQKQQTGS